MQFMLSIVVITNLVIIYSHLGVATDDGSLVAEIRVTSQFTAYDFNKNWPQYQQQYPPINDRLKQYYSNLLLKQPESTARPEVLNPTKFEDVPAAVVETEQRRLQAALQWLYQAQAAEKWEEEAIERTQQVADDARDVLDKATDEVRMKSADLQRAREKANEAAQSAHTAIVSLSAHDQLMNRARQLIYGLTAQVITIQSQLLEAQQKYIFNRSRESLEADLKELNAKQPIVPAVISKDNINMDNSQKRSQRYLQDNLINNNNALRLFQQRPNIYYRVSDDTPSHVGSPANYVKKWKPTVPVMPRYPVAQNTYYPYIPSCYCVQPYSVPTSFNSWQRNCKKHS